MFRAMRPLANDEEPGHLRFVEGGGRTAPLGLCGVGQAAASGRPKEDGTESQTLIRVKHRLDGSQSDQLTAYGHASPSAGRAFLWEGARQEQVAVPPFRFVFG